MTAEQRQMAADLWTKSKQ